MIDEIQVENLALIRQAALSPCAGLTVLTGETGAGKTALLSACKLLLGERADKGAVRDGAESLSVAGRFFLHPAPAGEDSGEESAVICTKADDSARDLCAADVREGASGKEAGASGGLVELVVTRSMTLDGRSRATMNGRMVSAGELSQMVAPTVDLCGQHEHQRLMRPASHVGYLDAWAGADVAETASTYRQAFAAVQEARAECERVRAAGALSSAQLEEARFTLRRINEVNPQEGEYDQVVAQLAKAEHAEALLSATGGAFEALSGEEGCALDALNGAIYMLDNAARYDSALTDMARGLRDAVYLVEDSAADLRAYRDSVDLDLEELERLQERASVLQGLLRLYGPRMEEVFAARDAAAELISLSDDSTERLAAAEAALAREEERLVAAADVRDAARSQVAPQFAQAVTAQMGRLCMGDAQLVCELTRLPRNSWTAQGASSVEFLFKAGADMAPRPFARIASGGEVSRVMLALKVVLGATDKVETLIFDEVDAGVGGATAVALAEVLADLAETHQVIVVTHLAQVAVRANAHFVVRKSDGATPETTIVPVEGAERIDEIARMLSGDLSETARLHAAELLAAAHENACACE